MGYKPEVGEFYRSITTNEEVKVVAKGPITLRVKGPETGEKVYVYSKFMKNFILTRR